MTPEIEKMITDAVGKAVSTAASGGAYEPVVLVLLMLGGGAFSCLIIWLFLKRHLAAADRAATRIYQQDDLIRDLQSKHLEALTTVIRDSTGVMARMLAAADSIIAAASAMTTSLSRLTAILETRPCLRLLELRPEPDRNRDE